MGVSGLRMLEPAKPASLFGAHLAKPWRICYELAFHPDHLRPILSASCVGRAALDDVRNWVAGTLLERPARQLLSAGLATEVRS